QRGRLVEAAAEERDLTEERVRLWELRILSDRLLQLRLRGCLELQTNHHLRGPQVRPGGLPPSAKGASERPPRALGLMDPNVGLTEDVPDLGVVRRPLARGFEPR